MSGTSSFVGGLGQQQRQEIRQAVFTIHRLETALELARARAITSRNARVALVCGDLLTIAEAEKELVVRQSPFAQPIGQAVKQTIQQAVQELQQHAADPEVQQAVAEAQQSVGAIDSALQQIQFQQFGGAGGTHPTGYTAGQFGAGIGQGPMARQLGQDVRQTAMRLHTLETALQLARVSALDQGNVTLARLCADLAIVTELGKKLVVRRSPFAQPIGQAVEETIRQGVQQLQQHADQPEVQEAVSEAQGVLSTLREDIAQIQTASREQQLQWGQQFGGPQGGSQWQPYGGIQQPQFGQQPPMGQQPQYGQQPTMSQQPQYGQQQPMGQQPQFGQQHRPFGGPY